MNTPHQTCSRCSHFDSLHNLCPMFTVRHPFAKVYLKRLPESPICKTEFLAAEGVEEDSRSINVELF